MRMKLLFSLGRRSSNGKTITLTFASCSLALRGSGVYDQLRLLAHPVKIAPVRSTLANRQIRGPVISATSRSSLRGAFGEFLGAGFYPKPPKGTTGPQNNLGRSRAHRGPGIIRAAPSDEERRHDRAPALWPQPLRRPLGRRLRR